jgi:recombination protein RecT
LSNLQKRKPTFSEAMQTPMYKNLITNTLGDTKQAMKFSASILSAVATNPVLQECDAGTILAGALLGESLNLSPSPQLGQYFLIPYDVQQKDANGKPMYQMDDNGNYLKDAKGRWIKKTVKKAQFQLGYKGYVQLAIRSGVYKKLNVCEIKEGELIKWDELNEIIHVSLIEDFEVRENTPTIGYVVISEQTDGFCKVMYWTYKKMLAHADKYSKAFSAEKYKQLKDGQIPEKDLWQYSSYWYSNFDEMAKKTMLRQLLSKWGLLTSEVKEALEKDMSVISQDGNFTYVDNDDTMELPEPEQPELPEVESQPIEQDEPKVVTMNDL